MRFTHHGSLRYAFPFIAFAVLSNPMCRAADNWYPDFTKTFVASIYNFDNLAEHQAMFTALGQGGTYAVPAIATASFYMNETYGSPSPSVPEYPNVPPGDDQWTFDPWFLTSRLDHAATLGRPVIVALNGGPWLDSSWAGSIYQLLKNDTNYNSPTTNLPFNSNNQAIVNTGNVAGESWLQMCRGGSNSPTGTTYRLYKERNIKRAAQVLLAWAAAHPGLLVAVTTDSEITLPPSGDYSKNMLDQFRNHESALFGGSLSAFNAYMQTNFASWSQVDPRAPAGGGNLSFHWQAFRKYVVEEMVADTVVWLREAGIPSSRIFTHQIFKNDDGLATDPGTGQVPFSSLGLDPYGSSVLDGPALDFAKSLDRGWAAPEWSPLTPTDYNNTFRALKAAHIRGVHFVMGVMWTSPDNLLQIKNSAALPAYRDFVNSLIGTPYGSHLWQFLPSGDSDGWDFYTNLNTRTVTGGTWSAKVTSVDPYIHSPTGLDFGRSDNNQRIEFSLKISGSTQSFGAQVFWITDVDSSWGGSKVKTLTTIADNTFHTYSVDVGDAGRASGRITRFRIDPCEGSPGINRFVTFDWIRVVPGDPTWAFLPSGDFEGWGAWINHIGNLASASGVMSFRITGGDPFISTQDNLGHVASESNTVVVRMRLSGGGTVTGALGWRPLATGPGRWRGTYFSVTADGAWREYSILVGTHADWYGTIDQLRLDPVENGIPYTNQLVEIDYVKIIR